MAQIDHIFLILLILSKQWSHLLYRSEVISHTLAFALILCLLIYKKYFNKTIGRWFGLAGHFLLCHRNSWICLWLKTISGDRYPMSISSPTSCHSTASTPTAFYLTYLPFHEPTPEPLHIPFLLLEMPFLPLFPMNIWLAYIFRTLFKNSSLWEVILEELLLFFSVCL